MDALGIERWRSLLATRARVELGSVALPTIVLTASLHRADPPCASTSSGRGGRTRRRVAQTILLGASRVRKLVSIAPVLVRVCFAGAKWTYTSSCWRSLLAKWAHVELGSLARTIMLVARRSSLVARSGRVRFARTWNLISIPLIRACRFFPAVRDRCMRRRVGTRSRRRVRASSWHSHADLRAHLWAALDRVRFARVRLGARSNGSTRSSTMAAPTARGSSR